MFLCTSETQHCQNTSLPFLEEHHLRSSTFEAVLVGINLTQSYLERNRRMQSNREMNRAMFTDEQQVGVLMYLLVAIKKKEEENREKAARLCEMQQRSDILDENIAKLKIQETLNETKTANLETTIEQLQAVPNRVSALVNHSTSQ